MKKILFCLVVALGLMGCDGKLIDPTYQSRFIYFNKCSTEVSVTTFSPKFSEVMWEETYTIPVGRYHTLSLSTIHPNDTSSTPWRRDSTVISNGEKMISIPAHIVEGIHDIRNYLIYSDEGNLTWIYAFTDDFFADGEPVEPSEP